MSKNLSVIKRFTRGGQVIMHTIRMLKQASKYAIKITLFLALTAMVGLFFYQTDSHQRYLLKEHYIHAFSIARDADNYYKTVNLRAPTGKIVQMRAGDFVNDPRGLQNVAFCKEMACRSFWYTLGFGFGLIFFIGWLFIRKGDTLSEAKTVRGMDRTDDKTLATQIKNSGEQCELTLAGIPIPRRIETQHFLMAGTIGSGKSQGIMEMIDTLRTKKRKAIILDLDGTYTSRYYRPGKDILLNPLDERCPNWDVWHECEDSADFEAFAESLMPLHLSNSDPFWINSARTIFSVAAFMMRDKNPSMRKLLAVMLTQSLGKIEELVKNTVAETLVAKEIEKTALSIKATLSTYSKCLLYLPNKPSKKVFSIQKWVTDEDVQDSWLFIGANKKKTPALRPLLTAWMDVAIRSTLSLEEDLSRRIWFVCDEIASLQRLPTLGEGAAEGRKCGLSLIAGIQDINQFRTIYGRDAGEALLSHFNTKLCLRTNSTDTAHWVEKIMCSREVLDVREGKSYGSHEMRDGESLSEERRKESLVLDSEVMKLYDLEAFIKLPGEYPVAKVKIPLKERRKIESRLKPRLMQDVLLAQGDVLETEVEGSCETIEAVVSPSSGLPSSVQPVAPSRPVQPAPTISAPSISIKPKSQPPSRGDYEEIEMPNHQDSLFSSVAAALNLMEGLPFDTELENKARALRFRICSLMGQGLLMDNLQLLIRQGETPHKTRDKYIQHLRDDAPGGRLEMEALSRALEVNLVCHSDGKIPIPYPVTQSHSKSIHILDKDGLKYSLLVLKQGEGNGESQEVAPVRAQFHEAPAMAELV